MKRRAFILLAAVWLVHQLALWAVVAHVKGLSGDTLLRRWDSAWYNRIVAHGYSEKSWVFFPLYPACVRLLNVCAGPAGGPHWTGAVFSTLLFCLFCALVLARREKTGGAGGDGLTPATITGWAVFLFQPGAYVFHSHHTESLFLVLSWGALALARDGRWLPAAGLSGLSALTRLQGVWAAAAAAWLGALSAPDLRRFWTRFLAAGLVSAALASLYPLYQASVCGDPLAFLRPQTDWVHPACAPGLYAKTFLMLNPWQTLEGKWLLRQFVALVLLGSALRVRASSLPLAFYVAASLLTMPLQGEFSNVFRFGAVLFPAWFALGDAADRLHPAVRVALVLTLLGVGDLTALDYACGRWAY